MGLYLFFIYLLELWDVILYEFGELGLQDTQASIIVVFEYSHWHIFTKNLIFVNENV